MLEFLSQTVPSLLIIVGIIIGLYVVIQFRRGIKKSKGSKIKITRATSLGGKAQLVEVVWQGKILLLSTNSEHVNLISEINESSNSISDSSSPSNIKTKQETSFAQSSPFSKNTDNIISHNSNTVIHDKKMTMGKEVVEKDTLEQYQKPYTSDSSIEKDPLITETREIKNTTNNIFSDKFLSSEKPKSRLNIDDKLPDSSIDNSTEHSQIEEMEKLLDSKNIQDISKNDTSNFESIYKTDDKKITSEEEHFKDILNDLDTNHTDMNTEHIENLLASAPKSNQSINQEQQPLSSSIENIKNEINDLADIDKLSEVSESDPFVANQIKDKASEKISSAAEEAAKAHMPFNTKNNK